MASTVLASRNQTSCEHQSFMGEVPNYSNNNPRHLNPNRNQKPKSNMKKHFPNAAINGRPYNHNSHPVASSAVVVSQVASNDAYSFNQRPIEISGGGGYGITIYM
ncbi:hypothetical protein L2E82_50836 [Cichorium intybus]|nr:hypothetical protein L2E82_50836 [Cichorium intybus]